MKRRNTDCLTHCVAYYFGLRPSRVPHFVAFKDWRVRLSRFFARRGLTIRPERWTRHTARVLAKTGQVVIVQGVSPRQRRKRLEHAVVFRGNSPVFDPHWSQVFLHGRPTFVWIPRKRRRDKVNRRSHGD